MCLFNAEEYWGKRDKKVWVVSVNSRQGSDKKIVRARTREGAESTAIYHSMLNGKKRANARLATPSDLGIH